MIGAFRNAKIGTKMTVLGTVASTTSLVLATAALMLFAYRNELDALHADAETLAHLIADNATAALSFSDAATAAEILSTLRAKPQVLRSCLWAVSEFGAPELFASYEAAGSARRCTEMLATVGTSRTDTELSIAVPVELLGQRIGTLSVTENLAIADERLKRQAQLTLLVLFGSLLLTLPLVRLMQRAVADPILQLSRVASEVSTTNNFSLRVDNQSDDEIGQLSKIFNDMLAMTERRNREIQDARDRLTEQVRETQLANTELATAMERLQQTQEQLVQNEKLASLGGLVAGVAHEINTPVGVGVTAASTLEGQALQLRSKFESGDLRKSELEAFVEMAVSSSGIIMNNLRRAADLVQSFKQVAVDQSSAERRRFQLREYVEEILTSLTPKLKKMKHEVQVEIDPGLEMDSYPGALAQVITNLVSNSLLHAYGAQESGRLKISASQLGDDRIEIRYADDGCGMSEENTRKVFDPFFTTRRGSGGSGLGMHIVYNLVTQVLLGSIRVLSTPGDGTQVIMQVPRCAGEHHGNE